MTKMLMKKPSKEAIDSFLNHPKGRYKRAVIIIPENIKIDREVLKYAKEKDVKFYRKKWR